MKKWLLQSLPNALDDAYNLCMDDGWWVDVEDFDFEPYDYYTGKKL